MTSKGATDIDKAIGVRIRRARLERDVTQEKLGDLLGVSFQQIQKYESGKNRVSASALLKVCRALDKPFNFFIDVQVKTPDQVDFDALLGLPEGRDLVKTVVHFSRSNLKTLVDVAGAMREAGART